MCLRRRLTRRVGALRARERDPRCDSRALVLEGVSEREDPRSEEVEPSRRLSTSDGRGASSESNSAVPRSASGARWPPDAVDDPASDLHASDRSSLRGTCPPRPVIRTSMDEKAGIPAFYAVLGRQLLLTIRYFKLADHRRHRRDLGTRSKVHDLDTRSGPSLTGDRIHGHPDDYA